MSQYIADFWDKKRDAFSLKSLLEVETFSKEAIHGLDGRIVRVLVVLVTTVSLLCSEHEKQYVRCQCCIPILQYIRHYSELYKLFGADPPPAFLWS